MAGLAKATAKKVIKHKKHGKKKFVRPSQKKSVKNGRHQEKETPKEKAKKTVKAIPPALDGPVECDDLEFVDETLDSDTGDYIFDYAEEDSFSEADDLPNDSFEPEEDE